MKDFDLLVMGELNVDLILNQLQTFPAIGKEVLAKQMSLTLGSSAAIFACNAASLGTRVVFLGKVGADDFGDYILKFLVNKKVDISHVERVAAISTGATIILNFGEDRSMVTHPGTMELLSGNDFSDALAGRARHLHISSVFLQPLLLRDLDCILKKAKAAGLTTSLDPQWDPAEKWNLSLATTLPYVDLFLPNETELLALTNCLSLEEALRKLEPFANTVVVKRGSQGAVAWAKKELQSAPAFVNPQVVDAIGAGDSFDAGFVHSFLQGRELTYCLRQGNLAGALNTTAAGGTTAFTSLPEIREKIKTKFGVAFDAT